MVAVRDISAVESTGIERIARHASWTKAGPVVSRLPDDEIQVLEERAVATVADASTLGLFGFATGTWMIATVMGGLLPADGLAGSAPVLLIFAGLAQFIAGLFAYRRAHALAGTAFCCFGAFNVTIAMTFLFQGAALVPTTPAASLLLGFLLISFGFIALALAAAALRVNAALVAVFGLLCVGYVLTGIPHLSAPAPTGGPGIVALIGSCFLLASALCAYYAGAALIVNSTWNRTVLPLGGEP